MPGIEKSLDIFAKFIDISKEIAKLPALVLPQYQAAAQDMYRICQKLLTSNENLSRWLYKFIYFDFRQQNARTEFINALQAYKTMKSGPEYQQLKFSCNDTDSIYHQNISSKIANWFSNKKKKGKVEGIFKALTYADAEMVSFTYDEVISGLDRFLDQVEKHVDSGAFNDAEENRLKFKVDSKDITEALEKFSGELSNLVISFANSAKIPITHGRTN